MQSFDTMTSCIVDGIIFLKDQVEVEMTSLTQENVRFTLLLMEPLSTLWRVGAFVNRASLCPAQLQVSNLLGVHESIFIRA